MNNANPQTSQLNRSFMRRAPRTPGLSAAAVGVSLLAVLFAMGGLSFAAGARLEHQVRADLFATPEGIVAPFDIQELRHQVAGENERATVLAERHNEIFNDPASPVGANPQGDVTLVEFLDYNCPHCRGAASLLAELEQTDKGLRLVFKEFPILGPGSTFAARAALASQKQGKYLAFHRAMMAHRGVLTASTTLEVATAVGLDIEQLRRDMKDAAIDTAIERNLALAEALRIFGTPSFIAGQEILCGLADADTMQRLIANARRR